MPLLHLLLFLVPLSSVAKDLGELSANPYQQNSTANPYERMKLNIADQGVRRRMVWPRPSRERPGRLDGIAAPAPGFWLVRRPD